MLFFFSFPKSRERFLQINYIHHSQIGNLAADPVCTIPKYKKGGVLASRFSTAPDLFLEDWERWANSGLKLTRNKLTCAVASSIQLVQ